MEEGRKHLEEFIKSFICKSRSERWNYYLLEKPEKVDDLELMKFYGHRNEDTTEFIKREDLPKIFGKDFDKIKGFYFDDWEKKTELTTFTIAFEKGEGREAIFSVKAGVLAIFFTHEYEFFFVKNNSVFSVPLW